MISRLLLPFMTLLFFYSESLFVHLFPSEKWFDQKMIVPHFLILVLFFICAYFQYRTALVYGFIFGFLFDIYYTEINGIYLVLFPFVIFLSHQMMKVLHNNLFVLGIISLVNVSVLEFLVYQINLIIKRTDFTFMQFVDWRLWPTLALNALFYLIFAFPLKSFLQKKRKDWLDD
ncbi:rod shape-determining protein MreD [Bacillus sp. KH172YL63]|uniref:rod shape-determining protein MreD n=1 Tax=Bacillus sp. KH172YL63 TaxID=2709784 RepID=UPI0013E456CE|nr:rod shape-determining protein MreD [Bacillus sp. KH172YL63]BCB04992.1 rod shape-determining protein MreD [Bacillus sp. KH172YL63]